MILWSNSKIQKGYFSIRAQIHHSIFQKKKNNNFPSKLIAFIIIQNNANFDFHNYFELHLILSEIIRDYIIGYNNPLFGYIFGK